MDARRASSPSRRTCRLLLRVYAAENLRHVSSQGTYCKVTLDEGEAPVSRSSARASLKRFLHGPDLSASSSDDPLALASRMVKTSVQKSPLGKPVWNEKFEFASVNPALDSLQFRIKSARLMSAPAIGGGALALSDVALDETVDQYINLFDNSRRPAGRLRIQVRVVSSTTSTAMESPETRDTYYHHPRRTSSSSSAPSPGRSPLPRSNRRGAIIAPPLGGVGTFRRSSTLSRSLLDMRTSGSTTASDSISSSDDRNSVPVVAPYTPSETFENPEDDVVAKLPPMMMPIMTRETHASSTTSSRFTGLSGHDRSTNVSRTTALSVMSRDTEELDFLASKYMAKPNNRSTTVSASRKTSYPTPEAPPPPPPVLEHVLEARTRKSSLLKDTPSERELLRRISNQVVVENDLEDPTDEAVDVFDDEPVSTTSSAASSPSASPPTGPSLSEIKRHKSPKDERSPRTTNTTAVSSDDDDLGETVEFDFDTGDVRPSTRLPSHMMRSTLSRPSIAASLLESENEESSSDEDEPEDDEMDPDGDPDGPRMVLRATVTRLLRRDSVNVIMDIDEEDEDDDDFELEAFVVDEFPILDMRDSLLQIKDVDCMDHVAAAS